MTAAGFAGPRCPVNDDKAEAHCHKQETNPSEAGSQDFGEGAQWLLFFGYNANVEDSREDENETRSRCGTNDSKDAQYVGSKDDQEVDEKEQNESNGDVARPVERLIRKRHLLDRSPYRKEHNWHSERDSSEHSHTHTQNQSVVRVNAAVCVEQLCFHFTIES